MLADRYPPSHPALRRAEAAGSFVGWLLVSIPLVALVASQYAWALEALAAMHDLLELLPW